MVKDHTCRVLIGDLYSCYILIKELNNKDIIKIELDERLVFH